jgi:hypothetical protein
MDQRNKTSNTDNSWNNNNCIKWNESSSAAQQQSKFRIQINTNKFGPKHDVSFAVGGDHESKSALLRHDGRGVEGEEVTV